MSDLTDNSLYLSAERIWLCICLNNAGKWACDRLTEDADFVKKKIIFSGEARFDLGGYVNKQNFHIWGTETPQPYIEKPMYPKTSHCLVRILVQRHNWVIFLRKCARKGRYSQRRSLSDHFEWIFVHKNWRGAYWQHLVSTGRRYVPHSRSYTRCFAALCFYRSHYQLSRADVVWPPRSCDLTPLDYYLCVGCRQT